MSATNVPLRDKIRQELFREDLYQRLNGFTLIIPPLRQRREDLPALIAWEFKSWAEKLGKKRISAISPLAMDRLMTHSWPGNLRELDHAIRTVVLLAEGETIQLEDIQLEMPEGSRDLPSAVPSACADRDDSSLILSLALGKHVNHVFDLAGGNRHRAARLLGMSRSTLQRHLRKAVRK